MMDQDELLDILQKKFSTDNKGDYVHVGTAMTMGIVVDTDDPLQQGRLRVFCPSFGDNPEFIFNLPWSSYVTPYGGVINNPTFERNGQTTQGAVAYGMWAIPDLGANVLVGCIDGDLRKRYWIGCIYDQQQTHTLFNGRYQWGNGGQVNGPLSSDGNPIQPAYENLQSAFNGDISAPEYQTRVGDYTAAAVDGSLSQLPNNSGQVVLDQEQSAIASAQQFPFNEAIVGGHGYDYSGFTQVPMKASRVFGWTTPGFHTFMMDDRPSNMRGKWRSATGHMIILDDTNERIRISTNKGNNYIEMDSAGSIDVYSSTRVSVHSDGDINLDAGGTIRLTAQQGIYGYAGGPSGLPPLPSNPPAGEIRFQSQADMHLISDNLRQLSFANTIFEIGGSMCTSVGGTYYLQVEYAMNTLTNQGDYSLSVSGNYNLNVLDNLQQFAIGGANMTTKGDVNVYSYYGNMNLGAQQNIVQKSVSGNITMQAVGANSGNTGAVNIKAPQSQIGVSDQGATVSTSGSMNMQSGGNMNVQSNSPPQQSQPLPPSQVPDPSCSLQAPVPIEGYTGADLCARCAYNAGFRGQSLITAVAIAGAESTWNPNATGDQSLTTAKWGPSLGFWQVRTLVDPNAFSYPDTLRIDPALYDPQANANAAYVFSKQGQNFGPWSTYMSGAYLQSKNINGAITAVNNMCGLVTPTPSTQQLNLDSRKTLEDIMSESVELPIYKANPLKPSISFTDTGVIIQAIDDISFVSLDLGISINAFSSIKATSDLSVATINELIATVDSCCHSTLVPIEPMTPTGATLPITQIASNYFPYLDPDNEELLNFANFDINNGTIITS
jgi:uncharacterized protein (DUF2345 family)